MTSRYDAGWRSIGTGAIFVAGHGHGIMVMDPESGKVGPFLTRPRFELPNGLVDSH